jgi:uncharacterized protein (TIGR00369 family)
VAIGGYPPPGHFLGDLGIDVEVVSDTQAVARARVTPFMTGPDGSVRAGVLATVVDVVAGMLGVHVLRPDWMATADLSLQLVTPTRGPSIEARAELVRRGRTTMVVEALVFDVLDDGTPVSGPGGTSAPVAWSTVTLAILPGGNRTATQELPADLPRHLTIAGRGLDRPVEETLGATELQAAEGRISLPVHPYLHNSIGAVQGGIMAILAELAGERALSAAAAGPMVVTSLQVAYLALGRVGPITTRATVLGGSTGPAEGADGGDGPDSAVVELTDEGADNRLTTVVNVRGRAADVAERSAERVNDRGAR